MEHARLWKEFARGDSSARDALLNEHLTLVYHVAQQVCGMLSTRHELDELVSYGTLGLISALDSFDILRGLAFSTFAVPRIRGAILDELRRQDHVPRSVRRKMRALAGARETLSQTYGRRATDAEVAVYLGIDAATLCRWSAAATRSSKVSIDESTTTDDGQTVISFDELSTIGELTVEDEMTHNQEIRIMTEVLKELNDQERHVLVLYYHEELKMHEVADVLGVTESRVSQIRTRALAKLRQRMAPLRGATAMERAG
ncbi:MAG TPA: FliA/WhiG family RNA polymerase sigma factor [Gemmatimonadaceae bacterium]|nr:FliA/WhiG family RNA polymerase sigma factor [Gemmatimonadaceae bacterium]